MDNSLANKKIIVTGGNGYLGSFLVKSLSDKGAEVYIISIDADQNDHNFQIDITKFDELNNVIQQVQPDIVYHLAASISRNRDFNIFENMLKVNVTGTFNLLKSLENTECEQFIFTSTSEIYGNNSSPFHEELLPMPVSPYSVTKVMAENLIKTYCQNHHRNYTILRLFNFYGENMSDDFFISQMVNSLKNGDDFLMTKGEQSRDFLYVVDVISAMTLVAEQTDAYNETFNVCSGKASPLASIASFINQKIGGSASIKLGALPYRKNEVWEMIGSAAKINEKLGFAPEYNLYEGLEMVINK
ncbi:MAG: NAD-dependent epimerase/dehydratase family protein [Bacteroidetes bacterium]|nr:NAD-dependent epimerase/dehydratase family protein [Bacteroidota bacterium]